MERSANLIEFLEQQKKDFAFPRATARCPKERELGKWIGTHGGQVAVFATLPKRIQKALVKSGFDPDKKKRREQLLTYLSEQKPGETASPSASSSSAFERVLGR